MPNYRDPVGGLHFLESADFEHLLPVGSVEISEEEADAIRYPPLTLVQAQAQQITLIEGSYQSAIQQPVGYMGTTFQADDDSQSVLAKSLVAGSVPDGFFWLDVSNTPVQMTYPQLQGLAAAMLAQGQTAFAKKTTLKQQIRAAETVAAVQTIAWS